MGERGSSAKPLKASGATGAWLSASRLSRLSSASRFSIADQRRELPLRLFRTSNLRPRDAQPCRPDGMKRRHVEKFILGGGRLTCQLFLPLPNESREALKLPLQTTFRARCFCLLAYV